MNGEDGDDMSAGASAIPDNESAGKLPPHRALEIELDFAIRDYLRILQQQGWLRIFSLGIVGATANVVLPFIITHNTAKLAQKVSPESEAISLTRIAAQEPEAISLALIGLSCVFGLLGLSYVSLSARHDAIVERLKQNNPNLRTYFGTSAAWSDLVWPLCNAMVFLMPCFVTAGLSISLARQADLDATFGIIFFILTITTALSVLITVDNWVERRLVKAPTSAYANWRWPAFVAVLLLVTALSIRSLY